MVNTRNTLVFGFPAPTGSTPVEWRVSDSLVSYEDAVATMEARAVAIAAGAAAELVWLLEHPPLYTAGTSTNRADVIDARFPIYESGRGGQLTYHGPGQRVAYVMIDLRRRGRAAAAELAGGTGAAFGSPPVLDGRTAQARRRHDRL